MSISRIPAPQTERASHEQPSCLSGFTTIGIAVDRVTVQRELVCECGSAFGQLSARKGWEGFPWTDPLTFECAACPTVKTFFDSHAHGYDNVMGNGWTSTQGDEASAVICSNHSDASLKVRVDFLYNIDADEIDDELEDSAIYTASDCFDAVNVYARCKSCEVDFYVGGWELA